MTLLHRWSIKAYLCLIITISWTWLKPIWHIIWTSKVCKILKVKCTIITHYKIIMDVIKCYNEKIRALRSAMDVQKGLHSFWIKPQKTSRHCRPRLKDSEGAQRHNEKRSWETFNFMQLSSAVRECQPRHNQSNLFWFPHETEAHNCFLLHWSMSKKERERRRKKSLSAI